MKYSYGIWFGLVLFAAAISGWLIERKPPSQTAKLLEIPDNIDYYLADLRWQVFHRDGRPLYQIKSHYLEHYVREDISLMQQPDLYYFSNSADWSITSGLGRLRHEDNILEFEEQVRLSQLSDQEPMQVTTEKVVFESQSEIIRFPGVLALTSSRLRLNAVSGEFNFKLGHHQFNQVNAIYHAKQAHEPG